MVNVFYSPEYVGAAHGFDTTRKAKWIADSLDRAPIAGIEEGLVGLHRLTVSAAAASYLGSSNMPGSRP